MMGLGPFLHLPVRLVMRTRAFGSRVSLGGVSQSWHIGWQTALAHGDSHAVEDAVDLRLRRVMEISAKFF
jgi:hypothetical protein